MRYFLIFILFFGCVTPKKVEDYLKKNPEFNATQCAANFPIVADTFVNIYFDSVYVPQIIKELHTDTVSVPAGCPKPKVVTKVVTITKWKNDALIALQAAKTKDSIKFREKEAEWLTLVQDQIARNAETEARLKKREGLNKWAVWLAIFCAAIVIIRTILKK